MVFLFSVAEVVEMRIQIITTERCRGVGKVASFWCGGGGGTWAFYLSARAPRNTCNGLVTRINILLCCAPSPFAVCVGALLTFGSVSCRAILLVWISVRRCRFVVVFVSSHGPRRRRTVTGTDSIFFPPVVSLRLKNIYIIIIYNCWFPFFRPSAKPDCVVHSLATR